MLLTTDRRIRGAHGVPNEDRIEAAPCGAAPVIWSDLLFQDQLAGVLRADDLAILAAILIALDLRFVGAVGLL